MWRFFYIFLCVLNVRCELKKKHIEMVTIENERFQCFPIDSNYFDKSFKFEVQALQEACFALSATPAEDKTIYEIVFGTESNNRTVVMKNQVVVKTLSTPNILNPNKLTGFWITWFSNSEHYEISTVFSIHVGYAGSTEPFLVYTEYATPSPMHYMCFRNKRGGEAYWLIELLVDDSDRPELEKYVTTNGEKQHSYFKGFYPITNNKIHFKVQATKSASILLTTVKRPSPPMWEFVLSAYGNKTAGLYKNNERRIQYQGRALLDPYYYVGFWIRLSIFDADLILELGKENEDKPIMKWFDGDGVMMKYFSVATESKQIGYWKLNVSEGYMVRFVKTPNKNPTVFQYNSPILYNQIIFKVKAARNAWIGFTSDITKPRPDMTIVFGGWDNKETVLRTEGDSTVKAQYDAAVLDPTSYRGFWIKFTYIIDTLNEEESPRVKVEVGREDEPFAFMEYTYYLPYEENRDEPRKFTHYAIASYNEGDFTDWILQATVFQVDKDVPKFYRTNNNPGAYALYLIEGNVLEFAVKTSSNAHIALTTLTGEPMIEVWLGAVDNALSYIRKNKKLRYKVEVPTFDLLSDKAFRSFWIRWSYDYYGPSMKIEVGREGEVDSFMAWVDHDNQFLIKYFGVASRNTVAEWKFKDTWHHFPKQTPPKFISTYNNPDRYHFFKVIKSPLEFKVRTGRDAYIALSEKPEVGAPIIEILLGAFGVGWDSQYSYIRKNRSRVGQLEQKTSGLLNGRNFQGFWINWEYKMIPYREPIFTDYNLILTVGHENDSEPFLRWKELATFPINYFGVTSYNTHAIWQFQDAFEDTEWREYKIIQTRDNLKYIYIPIHVKPFCFAVKAPFNVYLSLSRESDERASNLTEIYMGIENNSLTIIGKNKDILNRDPKYYGHAFITDGILSADEDRAFWIDWNTSYDRYGNPIMDIYIGRDGDQSHFATIDTPHYDINFIGIATVNTTGIWHIQKHAVALPPYVRTYNHSNKYQFYEVPSKLMKFKVRATNDVYLALSPENGDNEHVIEIMLGINDNTESKIRKNHTDVKPDNNDTNWSYEKVHAITDDILNNHDFRSFWVEWSYGYPLFDKRGQATRYLRVRIGREGEVNHFLCWYDKDDFVVKFIGLSSATTLAVWKFEDDEDLTPRPHVEIIDKSLLPKKPLNIIFVITSFDTSLDGYTGLTTNNLTFQYFSVATKIMHFLVKTSTRICIALATRPVDSNLWSNYEIIIDRPNVQDPIHKHAEVTIRKNRRKVPERVVRTRGIFDFPHFSSFWVKWEGGVVALGRDSNPKPFMTWEDPDPINVNFVGLTSWPGTDTQWQIADAEVKTDKNETYEFFAVAGNALFFYVKANMDARIGFNSVPYPTEDLIEIRLGVLNNTYSYILQKRSPAVKEYYEDVILKPDDFVGFWLHWEWGKIEIGFKRKSGENAWPFMTWQDPTPFHINYAAVASGLLSSGEWKLKVVPAWYAVEWNSDDEACFTEPLSIECEMRYYNILGYNVGVYKPPTTWRND